MNCDQCNKAIERRVFCCDKCRVAYHRDTNRNKTDTKTVKDVTNRNTTTEEVTIIPYEQDFLEEDNICPSCHEPLVMNSRTKANWCPKCNV